MGPRACARAAFWFLMLGCSAAQHLYRQCDSYEQLPKNESTTELLQKLRLRMTAKGISAYIIRTEDSHQRNIYITPFDQRRRFISGFRGATGTAVVLVEKAALWTQPEYLVRARMELDDNWIAMPEGDIPPLTIGSWIREQLLNVENIKVMANAELLPAAAWTEYKTFFETIGMSLVHDHGMLDELWSTTQGSKNRPPQTSNDIFVLDMKFSGRRWQDKLSDVQSQLRGNADALIVTDLSEVAWLFNLRGSDVEYSPFFFAYAIVPATGRPKLYLRDHLRKLSRINIHLGCSSSGVCSQNSVCTEVYTYDAIYDAVSLLGTSSAPKIWISDQSSQKLHSLLPESKKVVAPSPIQFLQALKNPTEVQGIKASHLRDSVALIQLAAMLEADIKANKTWDEVNVIIALDEIRRQQEYCSGPSFPTVAAFGPNGAEMHYSLLCSTNSAIDRNHLLVVNSGGQYMDGTTDIARTFHFGHPTAYEKSSYTQALKNAINLAMTRWPANTDATQYEATATSPGWVHKKRHGSVTFNSIYEGPAHAAAGYSLSASEWPKYEGMLFSEESGVYQQGDFGVSLDTTVLSVNASYAVQNQTQESGGYLSFEPVIFVPFESKLIDTSHLNHKQVEWLNRYHSLCQEKAGSILLSRNLMSAYNWLTNRTAPFQAVSAGYCAKSILSVMSAAVLHSLVTVAFW